MYHPQSFDIDEWKSYADLVGKKITDDEINIIEQAELEEEHNCKLIKLYGKINKLDLRIVELTNLNGNCLFESLRILGLYDDDVTFRYALAQLLLLFKNDKFKFETEEKSLNELFDLSNNIEEVICDDIIYKYTFEIMCQDIINRSSWERIPTELLLIFISKLFNINFEIINHRTGNIIKIYSDNNAPVYYLGHLYESHYVPLKKKAKGQIDIWLLYQKYIKKFIKLGNELESLVFDSIKN